ncbi:LysR family transcriptional regulator [Companilactobacillus sp.]|jgi:DNA-binding transcriptional LysR family regulator|uniref:LysR family transcriptional regulator n=1 Tax=Companilactobacillus sp. TaxID=2767905 RepID=UPI0025BFB2C0|nr:LysR family transcriptional regulator [Companilactobacillus sp.]MCH4009152.1 LysR family transcriptional regulator [Companilactobacillus sp.]MCH4050669.1 LysR family transcriptional regulator [Companilactobacillus sp.]MCH4077094.1 LysR family transcriptional regulator [Companilactobacillus sp.]MCH4125670.1 LysR family transcriptional regulator [Companilactobacillus sp.]MCI1311379.1 LysR family transcriptional regulator [Companilactobacillus sp.]
MNISDLNIFEVVVACGSFSKAAIQLFMTPPAVMNRINELEKMLGVTLFIRNQRGVTLTKSGEVLHQEAPKLISTSEQVISKVRESQYSDQYIIRIGSSALNPASNLIDIWNKLSEKLPQARLQFIPLEQISEGFPEIYHHLGREIDILFGPFGMDQSRQDVQFEQVGNYNFTVVVHNNDPLADNKTIKLSDLDGKTLEMVPKGISRAIDNIYENISKSTAKITTKPTDAHYTIDTFNKFSLSNNYLLSFDCWNNILPGTVSIPLNTTEKMPYGFITPTKPNQQTKQFVESLKEIVEDMKK